MWNYINLTNERIYVLFTVRHTLSFMCSVHNCLGQDHYAHGALMPKLLELRAEVSKECQNHYYWEYVETTSFKETLALG